MRQPRVTVKQVEKVARKMGFGFKRHGRGSHDIWENSRTGRILVMSYHSGKIVRPGTMKQMLKSLELSAEEFAKRL